MLEYRISHMDVPHWDHIPSVELHHTPWLPPCPISAQAQLCHDGSALHVRLQAWEQPVRATLREPLDPISNDSCLEFFFAPLAEDSRYFNFELNPLGTLCLGFGLGRKLRVRQVVRDREIFHIRPFEYEGGWGVTFVIPYDLIHLYIPEFTGSQAACGNFYKCGDKTATPHYLAWAPLGCDTPDFHRRQDFGRLLFEG